MNVGRRLYTVPEVAESCGVDDETVRRWIRNDELKASKLGKGYRISKADLEELYRRKGGGRMFANLQGSGRDVRELRKILEARLEHTYPQLTSSLQGYYIKPFVDARECLVAVSFGDKRTFRRLRPDADDDTVFEAVREAIEKDILAEDNEDNDAD